MGAGTLIWLIILSVALAVHVFMDMRELGGLRKELEKLKK